MFHPFVFRFPYRNAIVIFILSLPVFSGNAQLREPFEVITFDQEYVHSGNRTPSRTFDFPDNHQSYSQVLLTVTLDEPDGGYDHWDRQAAVYVWQDSRNRFEIARYITPYRIGCEWVFDVTDYQSLLRGSKRVGLFIDTWVTAGHSNGAGWLVTATFKFTPGTPELEAYKVENLWNGEPRYGDPNNPISNFFTEREIQIDDQTVQTKLRFTVTGHGQSPNSENGAEFIVRGRSVLVKDQEFRNTLWRTDCSQNTCSPQYGTWQYPRAGWCPGAKVDPWDIDISGLVEPNESINLLYIADPYTNNNIVEGNPARHWVSSQVIYYRSTDNTTIYNWQQYQ